MKNILIKFLFLILNFLILYNHTFSINDNLKLELSSNKAKIWENIQIKLELKDFNNEEITKLEIEWINENFQKLWESNLLEYKNINWIQSSIYTILVNVKPLKKWSFNIWPAKINTSNKELISNTINLDVTEEIKQNKTIIKDAKLDNIKKENISIREITELNDIKWNINFFYFSFAFIYIFLWIIFLYWFYLLLNHYFNITEEIKTKFKKEKQIDVKINYFLEKIIIIENEKILSSKSEFYASINELLREYLEKNWIVNATKLVLNEIENLEKWLWNKEIISILKQTYLTEFNSLDDDKKERTIIIKRLKEIFT